MHTVENFFMSFTQRFICQSLNNKHKTQTYAHKRQHATPQKVCISRNPYLPSSNSKVGLITLEMFKGKKTVMAREYTLYLMHENNSIPSKLPQTEGP